jgi:hypothetical protein
MSATAVGDFAGNANQKLNATAVGKNAGAFAQGENSVAIGVNAGAGVNLSTGQGDNAVAIGNAAGQNTQGANAVAIGTSAGNTGQGENSVAIGAFAGSTGAAANSIILNGSGANLPSAAAGFFVKPVRNVSQTNVLLYDASGGEITYAAKAYVLTQYSGIVSDTATYNPAGGTDSVLFRKKGSSPFLSVKPGSSNLTNTGTVGWIEDDGRFYAPTAAQYLVTIAMYVNPTLTSNYIVLFHLTESNALVSSRVMAWYVTPPPSTTQYIYTTILNMALGDYFYCQVIGAGILTLAYQEEYLTSLQVREL